MYIKQAKEVRLELASDTENLIQSGAYLPKTMDENISGGALYSKEDLSIEGGTIMAEAANHAVKANDSLTVSGGELNLSSGSDGLHSEKDLIIDGGVCVVNGGTVLAIGASGMAESFGSASKQNSVSLTVNPSDPGTKILIADDAGNGIFSYSSAKRFSSIVFSSPELEAGKEYTVTVGNERLTFTQKASTTIQRFY